MRTASDTSISIEELTGLLRATPQGGLDLDSIDQLERCIRELGRDYDRWVTIDDARDLLGVTADQIVPALIQHGQVRSQIPIAGECIVRFVDILHERWVRESLLVAGGDELSQEQLQRIKAARPGTNPWERRESSPSA